MKDVCWERCAGPQLEVIFLALRCSQCLEIDMVALDYGHVDLMIFISYISDYSLMSSLYASRKTKTVGSSLNRLSSFHFADH